ncbi:MAG TPA: hypothetical protein VK952_00740 [Methylotenera sp.]|jgi:hypothetical protein|nr:hypothetical protein [Methylotenera sp.]
MRLPAFLIFGLLVFNPILAHAELSDISRIFRQTPSLNQFEVCQGGGCAKISKISLTELEWNAVTRIFVPTKSAQESNEVVERQKIAQAIGMMEDLVGNKIGTSADLAGTFFDGKLDGQQDCNDEAINSTTYMRLLKQKGLMPLHEIEDMRTRNFFFTGWPHTTAVIREIKTGERYAVDSWFYDNGHAATIVTFKQWKANFQPEDSPIGKTRSAQTK